MLKRSKLNYLRVMTAAVAMSPLAVVSAEIDGIAARVGSDTILKSDVVREMHRSGASEDGYERVRDELIDRKLIVRAASEAKMTMQEWVIESRIREIINKSFDGDRNKLMEALSKDKISYPEWFARMKEDMVVNAMRWQVIDKNVTASPSALRKEYADHPERYRLGNKVSVSVILLSPENMSKRQEVSDMLKSESFADIARRFSVDSHAAEGGAWKDVVPEEVFKPEVCEEISKMPKGTISHWIEIDGWSFLLRKDDDSSGKLRTFEEAIDDIENNVKEEVAKKAYLAWLERLRAETYIKVY